MPKFIVEFEETTQRTAIVYAAHEQAARDMVVRREEEDNYENPAPARYRSITSSAQAGECE